MEDRMLTLLLTKEMPETREKSLDVKRLTKHFNEPFIVRVRELGYNRVLEIQNMGGKNKENTTLSIVLEGVVSPDLRNGA